MRSLTVSDLDRLMSETNLSEQDLEQLIAYYHQQRVHFESGKKPQKETGPKMGLEKVMEALKGSVNLPAPAQAPLKRRKLT